MMAWIGDSAIGSLFKPWSLAGGLYVRSGRNSRMRGGGKLHEVGSVIMFHAVVMDRRHLNAFLLLGHHEVKSFLTCSHLCDIVSYLTARVRESRMTELACHGLKPLRM